ncbi:HIT-like domain-containing protein [Hypoxylon rubiginosum]|uniref:HIT-like domain-containing protein n=1 Tax=Hypoxylon rubiginosum TaxID=110542 RepID=A0ACC0CQW9_9PEZI|nr:HIT-like domain-containing protein [Hypoxylon rubiginosum]
MSSKMAACIFCKIVKGEIPCFNLYETERTLAFLDINPLSQGHALVIPKAHGAQLTDLDEESLQDLLPVAVKVAKASKIIDPKFADFNMLQNNGKLAHQEVDHVHFHMIPKPNEKEGLGIKWPQQDTNMDALKALYDRMKPELAKM